MDFDTPRWDCDTIDVVRCEFEANERHRVWSTAVSNHDFDPALDQIYKVYDFVRESIGVFSGTLTSTKLAGLADALFVEDLIDMIQKRIDCDGAILSQFRTTPILVAVS